tara:strand:- start:443 stop:2074 length:1632 start_codon:yes stop_codon:yes gene_type:complete
MMPPNAQNIGTTASNAVSDAHIIAGTNDDTNNFNTSAIDHTQSEVAKTFHFREFGNGSANGGTQAGYADASMLDGYDDIAYVMDDGLTSLSADDVNNTGSAGCMHLQGDGDDYYITFIGTGIAIKDLGGTHGGTDSYKWYIDGVEVKNFTSGYVYPNSFLTVAENLPYGTHILQVERVTANTYGQRLEEVSFHQPKKPPIPEEAVIISDYCLMADFVKQATGTQDTLGKVSKGVRMLSGSRDLFCNDTGSRAFYNDTYDSVDLDSSNFIPQGFSPFHSHASTNTSFAQVPFFGTNALVRVQQHDLGHVVSFNGGSGVAFTGIDNSNGSDHKDLLAIDSDVTLANNTIKTLVGAGGAAFIGYDLVSPIHTSHHYQPFETPYLHELVGGDRNMEQHNLICSPDGKTWDQITRDTSYLGNTVLSCSNSSFTSSGNATVNLFNKWRGNRTNNLRNYYNKDFAIAYDRVICLVPGQYNIMIHAYVGNNNQDMGYIAINGTDVAGSYHANNAFSFHNSIIVNLLRGDYIQIKGRMSDSETYNVFQINRV